MWTSTSTSNGRTAPQPVEIATGAFQRVVANLVRNARQHGSDARLAVDYDGDLVLRVIDDGPGIPPEDREKVFLPFYRLEGSRSRATGGSGWTRDRRATMRGPRLADSAGQ